MMALSMLLAGRVKWIALSIVVAGVLTTMGVQRMQIDHLRRDIAELQAAHAQDLQRAEAAARETEHAAAVAVKEANDAKDKEAARARAAAAGARDELGRLRSTLATLDSAEPAGASASAASGSDDAARARLVVGRCAESLAAMAETADACEARVIGLQGYIRAIQPAP